MHRAPSHASLWIAAIGMAVAAPAALALELPADLLTGLQAEKFAAREQAEAALLAWARQRPDEAMDPLYQQSRTAAEPEVRERCHDVLRELVGDEYLRNGVGYLGVRMNPVIELVMVAGEANPRFGIRLLQVEVGTPANKAGLVAGDLLLGVNDRNWRQEDSSEVATEVIKGFKAGTKVTVRLFREGRVVEVPVELGKRPAIADVAILLGIGGMPGPEEIEAAERNAKEDYFRRWLARKKGKTP